MGKKHTEEAVIPILLRKGILVNSNTKQIGVESGTLIGNKINGKLDFMRKMNWQIVRNATKSDVGLSNPKRVFVRENKWKKEKSEVDPMKESLKKKKKVFTKNK